MSERVKKWTPGPWVIDTDTRPAEICTIHHTSHDNGFVYVRGELGYWNADGDENMANARLISAAPALVEALEDMLADYRDACEEWDAENQEQGLEIIEKAEASLSLVYGETQ